MSTPARRGAAAASDADAGAETKTARIRVTEIFRSLQGEADAVGWPTVFVRLTGCPLRCVWCDTEYAFQGGEWWTVPDLVRNVVAENTRRVCVTGGEPLAQKACTELLLELCDAGLEVSLETSGALDVSAVDPRVARIVDVKAPGSGESARNRLENLDLLGPRDQVKFVIADRVDYEWAREFVRARDLAARLPVLFSPVWESLAPRQLADWILEDRLEVRMQMQLHKLLWGEERGR
jgi:7-carboxy-7-deazaguanine synthase